MPQKRCPIDADPRNHIGELMCMEPYPKNKYIHCTRIKGHTGEHHAHGRDDPLDTDEPSTCCQVWK